MPSQQENKIGTKVGNIKIVGEIQTKARAERIHICKCVCGKVFERRHTAIFRSSVSSNTSCGCLANNKKYRTKGDKYYRRLYHIWRSMLSRCNNEKTCDYARYGGRGINVCKRWRDFLNFYNDLIDTYQEGYSLERVDNNSNYEPENCKWIPLADQAKNKKTTIWIDGMCAKDWCKRNSVNYKKFLANRHK